MGETCRCGHLRELHASSRYACIRRFEYRPGNHLSHRADDPRHCDCDRFRRARWLDQHSPWRHLAVRAWWATPRRLALWIINHWPIPGRCWCDLWSSYEPIEDPRRQYEYRGRWQCLCDAPLPIDAGVPDGRCYCPTPEEARP